MEHDLASLVTSIYEAASEPVLLGNVVEHLRRIFRADGATLQGLGGQGNVSTPEIQELLDEFVKGSWYLRNPFPAAIRRHGLDHKAFIPKTLFSSSEMNRMDFYQDWVLKNGWDSSVQLALSPDTAMSVGRRRGRADFDADDIDTLNAAAGEIQRAFKFVATVQNAHEAGMFVVLDRLPQGVIILNWRGQVMRLNEVAERLLGDGLAITGNRLSATCHADRARFDLFLADALRPMAQSISRRHPRSDRLPLRRANGRPLLVEAFPLGGRGPTLLRQAAIVLLVTDPDANADLAETTAKSLFGLSPAEAKLAIALSRGESLEAYAASAQIGIETARKRLKSIFQKTDTHRQSELVGLLGRLRSSLRSIEP